MIRSRSCFVLAIVIQVICGQKQVKTPRELKDFGIYHLAQERIPRYCWGPPSDINKYECCPIPNLYSEEVMDLCGIEKTPIKEVEVKGEPQGPKKLPCQDGLCLMKNSDLLMMDNSTIDYEKLGIYIDKWAAAHPEFTEAILLAKPTCIKPKGEDWYRGQPPDVCDPDRVFICLQGHILWNCKLKKSDDCDRLKEHMEVCKPYYVFKRENNVINPDGTTSEIFPV